MARVLRTADEIRAAGAKAAADAPPLTERQIDLMVALITPVFNDVWHLLDADNERKPSAQRPAA